MEHISLGDKVSCVTLPRPVSFMNHETLSFYYHTIEPRVKQGITFSECRNIYRMYEELAELWFCELAEYRDEDGRFTEWMDQGMENYTYTRLIDLQGRFEGANIEKSLFKTHNTDLPHPAELLSRLNLPGENTQLLTF